MTASHRGQEDVLVWPAGWQRLGIPRRRSASPRTGTLTGISDDVFVLDDTATLGFAHPLDLDVAAGAGRRLRRPRDRTRIAMGALDALDAWHACRSGRSTPSPPPRCSAT